MVGGRSIIGTAVVSCRIVLGRSSKEDAGDKRVFEAVCDSCHSARTRGRIPIGTRVGGEGVANGEAGRQGLGRAI